MRYVCLRKQHFDMSTKELPQYCPHLSFIDAALGGWQTGSVQTFSCLWFKDCSWLLMFLRISEIEYWENWWCSQLSAQKVSPELHQMQILSSTAALRRFPVWIHPAIHTGCIPSAARCWTTGCSSLVVVECSCKCSQSEQRKNSSHLSLFWKFFVLQLRQTILFRIKYLTWSLWSLLKVVVVVGVVVVKTEGFFFK